MQIPGVNSTLTVPPAEIHQGAQAVAGKRFDPTISTLISMGEAAVSEGCCSKLVSCVSSLIVRLWHWISSWCVDPADKITALDRAKSSLKLYIQVESARVGDKALIVICEGNIPVWNHPTLFSLDILDAVEALPQNVMAAENITIEIVTCNIYRGRADLLLLRSSAKSNETGAFTGGTGAHLLKVPVELERFIMHHYERPEAASVRNQLIEYFTA